ncbi:MAG: hypothetical protein GF408_05985 [Candidatus Omnitrophica bacterium]|nr:hypothetical protein [Candidatus Omnitrophota bacterium]
MSIDNNINFIRQIEEKFLDKLPVRLGVNKKNELLRLSFEICRASGASADELAEALGLNYLVKAGKGGLFARAKKALMDIRYPSKVDFEDPHIMPLKISPGRKEAEVWYNSLSPGRIFVEKGIADSAWTRSFLKNFPEADIVPVARTNAALAFADTKDPVDIYNSRRKNIVLAENRSSFIKTCPCTKSCRRCGYWILNIGFGCPIDCSYCYLQTYSNAPGLILPANVEDYFPRILEMDKSISGPRRIGTGEFTDSLALDKYTGYSRMLIPFFRKTRNLVLELKTKVADIENVLEKDPHDNVVISWSINTPAVSQKYEKGGAPLEGRIEAALSAVKRGYKVGFHFDPIVCYEGWEEEYRETVGRLFSSGELAANTEWVSLGTLRYTAGLKQVTENRFADNDIFYEGEFYGGFDGKLRYPDIQRINMYDKMLKWIASYGVDGWIYLCMEPEYVWRESGADIRGYKEDRRRQI